MNSCSSVIISILGLFISIIALFFSYQANKLAMQRRKDILETQIMEELISMPLVSGSSQATSSSISWNVGSFGHLSVLLGLKTN